MYRRSGSHPLLYRGDRPDLRAVPGACGRQGAASRGWTKDRLAPCRVRALLPGAGEAVMVTRRPRRRKDGGSQIPTQPVSAAWIMSQPSFALGVTDVRAGRRIHRDYDLWDTN